MTDSVADRVREQVSGFAGGTGAITLTGTPVAGFQSFLSGWGASGTGDYCIQIGSQWEVGFGTLNAGGTTLARTTPYGSYSGGVFTAGAACNFSAGTLDVFGTIPAELAHYLNMREIAVAAASPTDIGAVAGSCININGSSTTISSFGTKKNRRRFVRMGTAQTITHNASSLICPGATSIAAAAGDTFIAQSDSSGNWRITSYQRANGLGGPLTLGTGLALSGTTLGANLTTVSNFLGSNVATNNSTFTDGPSAAQGSAGTWFVSGTVTFTDNTPQFFLAKLYDGTTVVASGATTIPANNQNASITLSGVISSPAGNLRIAAKGQSNTGSMRFNDSGAGKDSGVTCIRIA